MNAIFFKQLQNFLGTSEPLLLKEGNILVQMLIPMIDKIAKQMDVEWIGTGGQFNPWDELDAQTLAILKRFLKAGDIVVICDANGF